jgi:zinc and cadmium transporter
LQSILESFSKGAEHGHIHIHADGNKFPTLLFVSLCLHAFSEGLPIHHTGDNLLWAIIVHKVPIAIVLTTFLIQTKYSKKIILIFLFFFGIMSPLGVLLGNKIDFFTNYYTEITALIVGVFLHISTIILFESSENHKFNVQKFTAILLGVLLTIFSL